MTSVKTLLVAVLLAACSYPRYSPGIHYFADANLYLEPPVPVDPITREQAQALALEGHAYYVAEYGQRGLLRLRKTTPNGKVLRTWAARPDGGR